MLTLGILAIVSPFAISWLADLGRVISTAEVGAYTPFGDSWLLPLLLNSHPAHLQRGTFSMEDAVHSQRGFGWRDSHPGC